MENLRKNSIKNLDKKYFRPDQKIKKSYKRSDMNNFFIHMVNQTN